MRRPVQGTERLLSWIGSARHGPTHRECDLPRELSSLASIWFTASRPSDWNQPMNKPVSCAMVGVTALAGVALSVPTSAASAPSDAPRAASPVVITEDHSRELGLDSTTNTRDLGGYRTSDGHTVRWGLLFRSDAVTAPTARDDAILRTLRLRNSVDFRSDDEISSAGANQFAPSVRMHHVPLLDEGTQALSEAIQAVLRGDDPSIAEELLGDGKAEAIAAQGVINTVRSPEALEGFGETLRLLSRAEKAPMIFNCTAGKDRTGIFAALVLRLLRVPEATVLADYELSNEYRAAHNASTYARLAEAGVDEALLRPLLEQDGANLDGMFRTIEEDYGSFDRFLVEGLELDRRTIEKLRDKLLTTS